MAVGFRRAEEAQREPKLAVVVPVESVADALVEELEVVGIENHAFIVRVADPFPVAGVLDRMQRVCVIVDRHHQSRRRLPLERLAQQPRQCVRHRRFHPRPLRRASSAHAAAGSTTARRTAASASGCRRGSRGRTLVGGRRRCGGRRENSRRGARGHGHQTDDK